MRVYLQIFSPPVLPKWWRHTFLLVLVYCLVCVFTCCCQWLRRRLYTQSVLSLWYVWRKSLRIILSIYVRIGGNVILFTGLRFYSFPDSGHGLVSFQNLKITNQLKSPKEIFVQFLLTFYFINCCFLIWEKLLLNWLILIGKLFLDTEKTSAIFNHP